MTRATVPLNRSQTAKTPHGDTRDHLSPPKRASIRRKLLRWYDRHRRDLPWRRINGNGYTQWVAEIMLQQTRVETVIEYFERFLDRFPTLESLAQADDQQVLKQWEGLGYYRRALHLHRGVRQLVNTGKTMPHDVTSLRLLPGIGEYTSAAIASIAFGKRAAAVDGNVLRVLARLFGVTENVLGRKGKQRITNLANQLVPQKRPGDFNQAWMDLGSAVCTPRAPKCEECPLQSCCVAIESGATDTLPLRRKDGLIVKEVELASIIIHHRGELLVRRRPTGGLWSGLWEFPTTEVNLGRGNIGRGNAQYITSILDEMLGTMRPTASPERVATLTHRLTHRALTFQVYVVEVDVRSPQRPPYRWVSAQGLARLSVSTAHRRVFAAGQKGSAAF